jgi:hypothetical protein
MALPRIGGGGFPLNLNGAFASQLPLPGPQTASAAQFTAGIANASNILSLPAGGVYLLPAGTFYIEPGPVTSLQFLDPVSNFWRTINSTPLAGGFNVDADGGNVRLANLTGCPIGALITNAGSAGVYTNGIGSTATGLTVTPSAGGSVWVPVVGGTNNSTVTITAAGSNYSFNPALVCSPPPQGGIQMTATAVVTAGSISTVTVVNQGAGYTAAATITVINDYRDTTGSGGVITAGALVSSGQLTALYPSAATNATFVAGVGAHGLPQTAAITFTFAPASTTSAVAVMNFCVTGIAITAFGSTVAVGSMFVGMAGAIVAGTRASNVAGPIADITLTQPRPAWIQPGIGTGSVTVTGTVIVDPGFGFQSAPSLGFISSGGTLSTSVAATASVGGQTDYSWVQPF